jgi:hypothetical protein
MPAPLLWFSEIVRRQGAAVEGTRLVRHDKRGLQHWRRGEDRFSGFASYQAVSKSPFKDATLLFQFVPGPPLEGGDQTALFVAAHRVLDRWVWDGTRLPALHHPDLAEDAARIGIEAFDLECLPDWRELSERILVRWGPPAATRSWSQWLSKRDKEVLELHLKVASPEFPGFDVFTSDLEDLPTIPRSWQAALSRVSGVYLLTCPDSGALYVGSASGQEGLWQRWEEYYKTGHGGNVMLKERGRRNYKISILQICSSIVSHEDIIELEVRWKEKLGSRAHGLNSN